MPPSMHFLRSSMVRGDRDLKVIEERCFLPKAMVAHYVYFHSLFYT
jgi:hypothetical protein